MSDFFSNFDVVITEPGGFVDPTSDIQAKPDNLGGYVLQVNTDSNYFKEIFGEQREFTKHERQQIKLFVIGAFLRRDAVARREYLPDVEDEGGVDGALRRLAEGAVGRGEL